MISPAACGGSAGGREPPRWYGWWAKPLTARRLILRQPCARPSAPRRRRPLGLRQKSLRRNSTGEIGRRASDPLVRPIGAVSPSRIWSRPWPLARRPLMPAVASAPVDDRRRGDEAALLALVLRRQPGRLVGLVEQRPAGHARQHAAALVLVGVGAGVAPAERGHERAVGLRAGLAGRLLALPAARRPRGHRRRGGEDQAEPAHGGAAHEVVIRIPRRRRIGLRVGGLEALGAARAARGKAAPEHERAHAVGAEALDVVERAVGGGRAELEQLALVLEDRFLVARGGRGRGEDQEQGAGQQRDGACLIPSERTPDRSMKLRSGVAAAAARRRRRSARRPWPS